MSTTVEEADVHGSGQPATSNSSWRWCYECASPELPEPRRADVYCIACGHTLCTPCDTDLVHKSKTTSSHERMPINEYLMMERARGSSSPTDEEMNADANNKFCFFCPIDNRIHLQPRLASLVKKPHLEPSLVAFIGPTGVGKSFLLRLLLSLDGVEDASNIPLVGAPNDADSTSAELHMYASRYVNYPLLFVDSEGRGGSKKPRTIMKMWDYLHSVIPSSGYDTKNKVDEFLSHRFNHVQISYPRMLYIFSDVLCFVFTGDWREHESIMKPLLEWGKTAADGAANQHCPRLILIFNKTGNDAGSANNNDFGENYEKWVQGGKDGESDKNLRLYYSDPLVILIPRIEIDSPAVMKRVKELRVKIQESSMRMRESRREKNQLFTRRELHLYMQLAADTFTVKPDAPFDIYKASMARRPNSGRLEEYIFQFHKAVFDKNEASKEFSSGESFRISLSVLKKRIQWSLLLSIKRNAPQARLTKLPQDIKAALREAQEKIDKQMPCGAVKIIDSVAYRCKSLKLAHESVHCSGKERWVGPFTPEVQLAADNFNLIDVGEGAFQWVREGVLKYPEEVREIRKRLSEVRREEHDKYPWLKSVIFYQVCASCMIDLPTEVLSCGHIICSMCAKEEPKTREAKRKEEMHDIREEVEKSLPKVTINLTCPVCLDSAEWYSKDLPPLAGYRILSLDGGGVRGIVELCSLEKIMSYFPGMHVEDLFDIIVGTSTGGIIALALTVHAPDKEPERIRDVIKLFKHLCENIFSREMLRRGAQYEIILRLAQFLKVYASKYKENALRELLTKHLGKESLLRSCFGGPHVVITSCDRGADNAAVWFTSYNRRESTEESQLPSLDTDDSQGPSSKPRTPDLGRVSNSYDFTAADVAAATSAAPTYFEPYVAGGRVWVDGGVRWNGPATIAIREAGILWRGRTASALISLGCGQLVKLVGKGHSQSLKETVEDMVHVAMDSQKQCTDAIAWLKQTQPDSANVSCRLSPPIRLDGSEKCELDCVDKIPFLEKVTKNYLDSTDGLAYVEEAANLLFAALFYLHVEINEDTQKPNLNTLCIRSRSPLPQQLIDALKTASCSELPPFSVTVTPVAKVEFFWPKCKWCENIMDLPFGLRGFPLAVHLSHVKVTAKLHMCLPETSSKNLPLPISGMPCTIGRAN